MGLRWEKHLGAVASSIHAMYGLCLLCPGLLLPTGTTRGTPPASLLLAHCLSYLVSGPSSFTSGPACPQDAKFSSLLHAVSLVGAVRRKACEPLSTRADGGAKASGCREKATTPTSFTSNDGDLLLPSLCLLGLIFQLIVNAP